MFPTRAMTILGGDEFRDEYSLSFDGSNDNIRIPDITVDTDGSCAIVFWAKYTGGGSSPWCVLGNTGDSSSKHLRFVGTDDLKWENDTTNEESVINLPTAFTDLQWHHYVVVSSSGTVTAYQDGVACSITGDNLSSSNCTFNSIGGQGTGGTSNTLNGNISEIAVYNIALSSSQAKQIYNGREPFDHKNWTKTGNLTQWWRMGDGDRDAFSVSVNTTNDNTGFIQDMASDAAYTELVTGWTNVDYGTFVSSGLDVSSAISDGSASHEFRSNDIDITAGDIVEISFTIAGSLVPSSNLIFKLSPQTNLNSTQFDADITGAGDYHFFAQWTVTDSTSYVGIRAISEACNYSMTNFSCKRIAGANHGLIKNMSKSDLVGDTP